MVAAGSRRQLAWVLMTGALAASLACRAPVLRAETPTAPASKPANESPPKRRAYAVAAIGDSLTDPRSNGGRYLRFLAERCPESRFDSYGKGGEMVNQMRRRFDADVLGMGMGMGIATDPGKPHYTHVIVFGGVNDLYSDLTAGRTVKKITTDLSAMYAAAHEHGLHVVAVTVTPWGGFSRYFTPARAATTAELNRWILAQPAAGTVDVAIDAFPLLSCGSPDSLCDAYAKPFKDGLHFGPEGHRRIADALFRDVFADCR